MMASFWASHQMNPVAWLLRAGHRSHWKWGEKATKKERWQNKIFKTIFIPRLGKAKIRTDSKLYLRIQFYVLVCEVLGDTPFLAEKMGCLWLPFQVSEWMRLPCLAGYPCVACCTLRFSRLRFHRAGGKWIMLLNALNQHLNLVLLSVSLSIFTQVWLVMWKQDVQNLLSTHDNLLFGRF